MGKNTRPYTDRDGTDSIKLINYLNRGKLNIKAYRQTVRGLKGRDSAGYFTTELSSQ